LIFDIADRFIIARASVIITYKYSESNNIDDDIALIFIKKIFRR